ncbi:hypothetical protein TIFTF001_053343 [Ficus carica]|uniref:Uncharacterized protein n=2 Tax=Ficus carica TaxID=3494 RepID=A0AA88EK87_FICCA|nr:hypothetical protein TIFTF001_053340 [Ficus carica]GMN71039.1 hypothetical protein TIFTF001_053343 [Ficus carica]
MKVNVALTLRASSSGQQDCMAFQPSHVGGSASTMDQAVNGSSNCLLMNPNSRGNVNMGFPNGQVHSGMSLTRESSAADYQDCVMSHPVFLGGESWDSSLDATCPQARDKAKMRYNEKKKTRMYIS